MSTIESTGQTASRSFAARQCGRKSINYPVMHRIERDLELYEQVTCYAFRRGVVAHLRIEIGDLEKVSAWFHPREADGTIPETIWANRSGN